MKWITARRRHPLAGYAVVILALTFFGMGYAAFAPTSDRAAAQTVAAEEGPEVDISNGRQIFQQSCASCHGMNGKGSTTAAGTEIPSLHGVGAAAVDFQVSTGRMPSTNADAQMPRKDPVYSEQEIADLSAYVAEDFGGGPEIPYDIPGVAPKKANFETEEAFETAQEEYKQSYEDYIAGGDTAAGQKLYLANCAHCHSWSGEGGALTGGKSAPPLDEATPRQLYEAMLTGPGAMPVFNDTTITPEAKQSIITYVKELQAEPDAGGLFDLSRIGPVAEGYIAWTAGLGLIVAAAIWITAKQRAHD